MSVGIGHGGFRNVEDAVLRYVHMALLERRPVTITGHSLGGTCATRLMSMSHRVDQASVKLITFGAPHADARTAAQVARGNPNVRCCQTKGAPIPSAGETAIPARYFQTQSKRWSLQKKQANMGLVRHHLEDANATLRKYATEGQRSFTPPSAWAESCRQYFSR